MSVKGILGDMDWDEGLKVPVANAENKILEELIQSKQQEIVKLQQELGTHDDKVHALSEHSRNVNQELTHTLGLCKAREHQVETEDHLKQIAQREEGRLKQEIKRIENDLTDIKERKNIYENTIFKNTKQLEELKSQMNWDQQALEAWLEESARKDEDSMTLAKYTRMDEAKVKELSLRMQKMTDESMKKKKLLDHEMTQTLTAQLELDKTAEEFRKAHQDRTELIRQWEATIDQMQRRDREMDQLANDLANVKGEVRSHEEIVREKQQFLENELENNEEQQKKIQSTDRLSAKLRIDYQDTETQRIQFADELETLKCTVERTATDLEGMRKTVTELKRDVEDKKMRIQQAREVNQQLNDKYNLIMDASMTAEENAAMMDQLLQEEEDNMKALEKELRHLRELQYRKSQELYNSKKLEKDTTAGIQGSRAAIRNLASRISKLDHDSLKQQEIIYNQDFTIQQLERKISRLQGERSTEEMDALNDKIKELTDTLDVRNNTHQLLSAQLKRLQDDIRRVKRDLETSGKEKADLTSKIEELNLHNDSSQRVLKKVISEKQDLMVDENILKLEIKRLRDILNSKADTVFSLEKRRLQLETAMKERRQEIGIHKDMLKAQLKASDEEKSTVSSELHERISKIDKLRKRYEILMISMAPPEGEEDRSQAYYVIQAAQQKEELQRKGDDLDAKIRKSEKEIKALENTLRLMNGRNEVYRKSFNRVTETSEEYEEKQQLEEQLRAVMDKYKYKRRQIRELQDDLGTMSNTLDNLVRDENAYSEMISEKENKTQQLNKELGDQKVKIERVNKQNARYARELRTSKKVKGETHEERDFALRELRDFNKNVMKQMGEVLHGHPDLTPTAQMLFSQAGLPAPPPPSSPGKYSSRPGSSLSGRSVGSLGSVRTPSSIRSGESSRAASSRAASSRASVAQKATIDLGFEVSGISPGRSPSQTPPGSQRGSRPPSAASSRGSRR